jgi:hypothetical protein
MMAYCLARKWLPTPAPVAWRLFWICGAIGILMVLTYRLTLGVNLGDEAYYATFLDDWLKQGVGGSRNLVLHQTAELLVLPSAMVYTWIVGSERGLILFLRGVFLTMASVASLCHYLFVRKIRNEPIAVASALLVLCFIPFSLPAPSYNTIGMFGVVSALALFGVAATTQRRTASRAAAVLSGLAWMITVMAYPTLAMALAILLLFAVTAAHDRRERVLLLGYALTCAFFQLCAAGFLLVIYGYARLEDMYRFTNGAVRFSDGIANKIASAAGLLLEHQLLSTMCLTAFAIGVLSARRRGWFESAWVLLLAATVIGSRLGDTALFFRPHDVILLLTLAGLSSVLLRRNADDAPVVRVIFATSLIAGLITTLTSSTGFLAFPIGALEAASLAPAVLLPRGVSSTTLAAQFGTMVLIAVLFCADAFAQIYTEGSNPLLSPSQRLRGGAFAGLLTDLDEAAFITSSTAALRRVDGPQKKIVVVGPFSGLYLLTDMVPGALSSYEFGSSSSINAQMEAFYSSPNNRPDVIALTTDPLHHALPPWVSNLLVNYREITHVVSGNRSLDLYAIRGEGP